MQRLKEMQNEDSKELFFWFSYERVGLCKTSLPVACMQGYTHSFGSLLWNESFLELFKT